jgi:hypothetical protein
MVRPCQAMSSQTLLRPMVALDSRTTVITPMVTPASPTTTSTASDARGSRTSSPHPAHRGDVRDILRGCADDACTCVRRRGHGAWAHDTKTQQDSQADESTETCARRV